MNGPVPVPKRTVKPRKLRHIEKPIMAVDKDQVLLESGEVRPYVDLPTLITTEPSSIVVAHYPGEIVKYLDTVFSDNPAWQFRVTPVERNGYSPGRQRKTVTKDCIVGYFGFTGERKQKGHYHYALSPHIFCLKSVHELRRAVPGETATVIKLMAWAKEIRKFLQAYNLNLSATSGGIAAQLLKDEKFYPRARRKVPKLTNAKAREQLPGNYYKLYAAKEGRSVHRAAYLDQTGAHHTAAAELDFPCANTLKRHGRHSTLEDRPFARYGTQKYDDFIARHGLFYLAFEAPLFFDGDFPLPNCGESSAGYRRGYFYSNEIAYLESLGVRIRHIIACWVSPDIDRGLNLYAQWALEQIKVAPEISKPWLKPTLLSTYGVLAARPKFLEFGYKHAKNGEAKKYPCGSGFLDVQSRRTTRELEPNMANVIHRGMVEAQTRLRSLEFAKKLHKLGYTILAIYADSVFVESSKDLPFITPPWRLQAYLTTLRFQSSTHFTSQELSKTPGIPLDFRNRAKLPPRPERKKREKSCGRKRPPTELESNPDRGPNHYATSDCGSAPTRGN